jgi:Na+-driven multidrug efflux pump
LNIPEELKPIALGFTQIYAAGLLFHYVLINGNGILRSCHMVKHSLKTMALVCLINITLNFFLVFHTPIGFRGIALATASSVLIGRILSLAYVRRMMMDRKRFSLMVVKKMIEIGWPIGLLQVLWQLASMVLFLILSARWIVSFLSNNEIVIRESTKYIYISMVSEPFMAWGLILGGGLNGAGDTKSVLMRIAFSVWLVRIPLSYLFVILFGFGPVSVWWSMNLSQFVQAFLISKRYFNKGWW